MKITITKEDIEAAIKEASEPRSRCCPISQAFKRQFHGKLQPSTGIGGYVSLYKQNGECVEFKGNDEAAKIVSAYDHHMSHYGTDVVKAIDKEIGLPKTIDFQLEKYD